MPREIKIYKNFTGGLNTHVPYSDLDDNEFAVLQEMEVKSDGSLVYLGSPTSAFTSGVSESITTAISAGCYSFKMDIDGYEYFVIGGEDYPSVTTVISVYRKSGTALAAMTGSPFTVGTTASGNMVYYFANSQLRICDANFGANNNAKWLGNISRTLWAGTSYTEALSGYYFKDAAIVAPTRGVFYFEDIANTFTDDGTGNTTNFNFTGLFNSYYTELNSKQDYILVDVTSSPDEAREISAATADRITTDTLTSNWTGITARMFTSPGTGFNLFGSDWQTTGGTWPAGTYEFASTFIYDDKQESLLYKMAGTIGYVYGWYNGFSVNAVKSYNNRITGGRIYYRNAGSTDNWILLLDISFVNGIRQKLTDDYSAWTSSTTNGSGDAPANSYFISPTITMMTPPSSYTYSSLTSVSQDEHTVQAKFKTATVLNNIAWIGNVRQIDKNGTYVNYGKRIMFSEVGKYDLFPSTNYFDINSNESITRVAGYADRLFVFTENMLYIVNVSKDIYFVETEHRFMGALNAGAVHEYTGGIIWVNKYGLWMFDGNNIIDLLENNNRRKIAKSTWSGYITAYASVGFSPAAKKMFISGNTTTNGGTVYVYNTETQTFSTTLKFDQATSKVFSNFFLFDNEIHYATSNYHAAPSMLKWTDTDAYVGTSYSTAIWKSDDFDMPHVMKKIYSIVIDYSMKSGTGDIASNSVLSYSINDGSSFVTTYLPATNFTLDTTSETVYDTLRLVLTTPVTCEKFMLKLYTANSFRISSVGVEYRPIHKRVT